MDYLAHPLLTVRSLARRRDCCQSFDLFVSSADAAAEDGHRTTGPIQQTVIAAAANNSHPAE